MFRINFIEQTFIKLQHLLKNPLNACTQWLNLWVFILPLTLLISCNSLNDQIIPYSLGAEEDSPDFMKIRLLDSVELKSSSINSLPITEISDIAWDQDENLLYAVSDEGLLYWLTLIIKENKINTLKVIAAKQLKDINGTVLSGKNSDSEGLTLLNANNQKKGDTQLIISFENKPRIARVTTQGQLLTSLKIPQKISKKKFFKDKNKALESVIAHPKYGILTAAEQPLKSQPLMLQTIYSNTGQEWHYNIKTNINSAITGLEVLPNGDLMILERAYRNPITPLVITLRRLKLEKCNNLQLCETDILARFNGIDGWNLDNFEGITRVNDNQYLIVSDNNNNPFQSTIWVLFEITDSYASSNTVGNPGNNAKR
jgi:hypothetical protein